MNKTIEDWQFARKTTLSPRLANQALMDLLWEDLPEILERAAQYQIDEREPCPNCGQYELVISCNKCGWAGRG